MNDLLDSFNDTALNGLGIPGLSGFSGGAGVLCTPVFLDDLYCNLKF